MKTEEKTLLLPDGQSVVYYLYLPDHTPKAILQICHGMAEHLPRYADFAAFMTERDVLVCGCDHVGHGKSIGNDGTPGYFGKQGSALGLLVTEQKRLCDEMKKAYPGLPYILLGHSMGSFVARRFLTEYHNTLSGAIICGTAGPESPAGIGAVLARIIGWFSPEKKPSTFIGGIAFGNYNKRTGSQKPNSWLSKDESVVDRYNADPLCGFAFTASGYRQVFECIRTVNRAHWAQSVEKDLPILVTAGMEDPVGGYGKGPASVFKALKNAGCSNVSLKMYENDRHEILNETDRDTVYRDFCAFVLDAAGVH